MSFIIPFSHKNEEVVCKKKKKKIRAMIKINLLLGRNFHTNRDIEGTVLQQQKLLSIGASE